MDYRVAIYAAHANQVPLSAIGATILDVVKRTAPWLEPELLHAAHSLSDTRFELRAI